MFLFGWSQGPNLYLQRKRVKVDIYDKIIIKIIYCTLNTARFPTKPQHYFQTRLQQNYTEFLSKVSLSPVQ